VIEQEQTIKLPRIGGEVFYSLSMCPKAHFADALEHIYSSSFFIDVVRIWMGKD
jgi:hypothetical protein